MTVTKRLVAYHIGRLKDRNPQVRLNSINELALLGDTDALDSLREIYETDPDVDVRQAAQEAGREIFKSQHKQ